MFNYNSDEPVRVRGIMDDYSAVVNDEVVALFFEPRTFEIVSAFIDYDDDNRITFTLRNGSRVIQPRPSNDVVDALNGSESDEMRYWNIIKAHWQTQISTWPAMNHTWLHFHFNDLVVNYIEDRWKSGRKHCSDSVMDRIIRSHTLYTAVLNSAGQDDGWINPETREWNLCIFICAPWKMIPIPTAVVHQFVAADVADFWFKNSQFDLARQQSHVMEMTDLDRVDLVVGTASPSISPSNSNETNATNPMDYLDVVSVDSQSSCSSPGHAVQNTFQGIDAIVEDMHLKTADPDCFPPTFVRNRLKMFADDFELKEEWITMHRGFHIYKDMAADYYQVIHEEFTVKLHDGGYLKDKDLLRFVSYLNTSGYPGILECKRDGGYLHILSTFLWLNVLHSSDHTVADNIIRDFGIGGSLVPLHSEQWYRDHPRYDFVDVLEGKSFGERCRLQYYAMRIRVCWDTFYGPAVDNGFNADHMIDSHLHRHFVDVDGITEKERKEIDKVHKQYIRKMKKVDEKYRWVMPVEDFTAGIQY